MNLIILHGNGIISISQKLSLIKKEFNPLSIQTINGKDIDFNKAVIEFSTPQLFSEKRLIVLEEMESSGVDFNKVPADPNLTLVFKISKQLPTNSSLLKAALALKAQVISFMEKDEISIFPFLDGLAEKNKSVFLELDKLLNEYGGQYVLTMIFYMFRRLLVSPKKVPDFIARKIIGQQKNFSLEEIKKLYRFALETDFKVKSGLMEEKIGLTMLVNKILYEPKFLN